MGSGSCVAKPGKNFIKKFEANQKIRIAIMSFMNLSPKSSMAHYNTVKFNVQNVT